MLGSQNNDSQTKVNVADAEVVVAGVETTIAVVVAARTILATPRETIVTESLKVTPAVQEVVVVVPKLQEPGREKR